MVQRECLTGDYFYEHRRYRHDVVLCFMRHRRSGQHQASSSRNVLAKLSDIAALNVRKNTDRSIRNCARKEWSNYVTSCSSNSPRQATSGTARFVSCLNHLITQNHTWKHAVANWFATAVTTLIYLSTKTTM